MARVRRTGLQGMHRRGPEHQGHALVHEAREGQALGDGDLLVHRLQIPRTP